MVNRDNLIGWSGIIKKYSAVREKAVTITSLRKTNDS